MCYNDYSKLLYIYQKKGCFKVTFEEILSKVKTMAEKIDVSGVDFIAVQVNLKDLDKTFYVEVKDGKINVEPYEYNDRSCALTISSADFNKLIDGKLDPIAAFTIGKLKVDGDVGKALEFSKLIKNK